MIRATAEGGRNKSELEVAMRSLAADAPQMMRQVAQELAAHGRADVARAVLRRTRAWYEARPESERASLDYQLGYARTLFLSDDRAGARKAFEALLRAYPRCLDCIGSIGVLAGRDHDAATADSTVARLATSTRPFLFGRHLLWGARIAAASGDRELAAARLNSAFAAGSEVDILTHTDPDLIAINPDSVFGATLGARHSAPELPSTIRLAAFARAASDRSRRTAPCASIVLRAA